MIDGSQIVAYKRQVIETLQTETFARWLASLRDEIARKRIAKRIARVQSGLFGDIKTVGDGVFELRIDHGPGYRLYYVRRGDVLVILLCGGDKKTQRRDIEKAKELASQFKEDDHG